MIEIVQHLFGTKLAAQDLHFAQLILRGFFVYFTGMFLFRLQSQFMGINTPFNYMVNFIIGSLLAQAIAGEGEYFPILGLCFCIILMNWLIEWLCFNFSVAELLLKGKSDLLIYDGKIVWKNMRKNLITRDELIEAVRKHTQGSDIGRVKRAYFESSGEITVTVSEKELA